MLYGVECWAVKSQQEDKFNVAEMIFLHRMSGYISKTRLGTLALERNLVWAK